MSDLAGRLLSVGPTAEPLVDGSTHCVGLDLSPILSSILPDFSRLLRRRPHLTTSLNQLATHPFGSLMYVHALNVLRDDPAVQAVFLVPLHPSQASALADALTEATVEPDLCRGLHGDCPNYQTQGDLCDSCTERAENLSNRTRRAVRG